MTIVLLIAAVWLIGALVVLACCRAAALGDRALGAQVRGRRWTPGSHEHSLAA